MVEVEEVGRVVLVLQRAAPVHTRASFVVEDGRPGAQRIGGQPVRAAPEDARIPATIELDAERIEAQERADRKSRSSR